MAIEDLSSLPWALTLYFLNMPNYGNFMRRIRCSIEKEDNISDFFYREVYYCTIPRDSYKQIQEVYRKGHIYSEHHV